MTRTLRVAALQLEAHDRADFETAERSLRSAVFDAARGHDLLVLPEATLPAYVLGDDRVDDEAVARAIDRLRDIAKETTCVIVAGAAIRRAGKLYNSAVVIDADGTIAGSAEKIFLWHFDRKWFAPGERIAPVATRAGRLGVLICADGRMPGIARTLADLGAELLVMPTAWVTSGRDPDALENIQADLLARVRAFENGVPFVAANKCGVEMKMVAYCGKSQIVDGTGEVVAIAAEHEPGTIDASIVIGAQSPRRASIPAITQRSPESGAIRVAFSLDPIDDVARRLDILDAQEFIGPQNSERVDAEVAFDPGTLPRYRAAGYRRIVLDAKRSHPWLERVARARAAELRVFLIVFDRERDRAYAIDPDGAIVAGTYDGLRIASVTMDFRRTNETAVAPGTDVELGLAAVASIADAEERV
ncbi:MAG: carbon-nitrogen hydrolase family protein [Candidatus Eremiobacteraeota bacterium]|nr:carbon-nitrogen hydrolase family protein [Candidatus Eremiobacteraeota bacterium]